MYRSSPPQRLRSASRADELETRSSTSSSHSLDLPSLQPLSRQHPQLVTEYFDPDSFLLSRVHIPLDELRADLRRYLAVLREELVQLINDDYEEFISLGVGLRGEAERLSRLQQPLVTLSGDVEVIRRILDQHHHEIQEKLDMRTQLRDQKALLDLLIRLFDTLGRTENLLNKDDDLDVVSRDLSRIASEYTQILYLLQKALDEGCKLADSITERVDTIRNHLERALSDKLLGAVRGSRSEHMRQSLTIFYQINGREYAEEALRDEIGGALRHMISSETLNNTASQIPETPTAANRFSLSRNHLAAAGPLAMLYNRVLDHLEQFRALVAIAHEVSPDYRIFSRVLWPEISEAIISGLGGVIFAAGRPDELHQNFTTTAKFISHFEDLAPSAQEVMAMRGSDAFANLQRRWQLQVYFQLRWKEIIGMIESGFRGTNTPRDGWALSESAPTWEALRICWADSVFVADLATRFGRLSLQIISRYSHHLRSQLENRTASGEDSAGDEETLQFSCSAVLDLQHLSTLCLTHQGLQALEIGTSLETAAFDSAVIAILVRRCSETIKLVRSVASQFRAAPAKLTPISPSPFVADVFKPLTALYKTQPRLRQEDRIAWSTQIVDETLDAYSNILASVRKTEDLLRRHRKSKKTTFSLFGSSAAGDVEAEEERFKLQMIADVEELGKNAKGLGVDVSAMKSWKELLEVCSKPSD